ncbi:magnesium transporter [Natranaeroarchaeum sulfidigenes]|uniref:Permease, similar to cation transporter n=1 Tax=Natranaeroarchaeum sulfidigenes TaxID=2784880 RepID=A0A897MJN8_9EURY|nr:magnesium transporter [Natranaeroarchaeum sulfidigenes]QSG02320.1 Permease, similar to cation transporter [Natranaeroarchaeum sulfidigenes]
MVVPSGSLGSWETRSIVTNMFPLLVVLCVIVLWAGITLEAAEENLEEFALLAVMVPTMVDMGGNLGAILSSRLSTRLHLGTTEFDPRDRVLWANILAVMALAVTIFTALAIGAWLIGQVIGAALGIVDLLIISLISGLSVAIIAVIFSLAATYGSYRLGIDPDDTTIPVVTNVVDVFGMVIFIGVSGAVLGF